MNMPRTPVVLVLACLLSAAGLATVFGQDRNGSSEDNGSCKRIKARASTMAVTANCPRPIDRCTAGVVTGDEVIEGTTFANVLGVAPSVGLPGIEPTSSVSLAGERTIATSQGTLSFRFITVFDTARGEFAEIDRVIGGTGRFFEGAAGTLWLTGTGTRATAFEANLTGEICGPHLTNRP